MKRIFTIFTLALVTFQLFAFNSKKTTVNDMYEEVQKQLGHYIEKYEQNIIDTTYLYYYQECGGKWTKEIWEKAVDKSVDFCRDKVAVAASKAGDFGEKFLQSIIVTTEDLFSGFNNWLNKKSEEYKRRHQ
ncbi:MAG: hypothetical protein K5930_01280 [Treponemataceae bacterium]|nr:hypothetical protein [Treponemataceae bacterium]